VKLKNYSRVRLVTAQIDTATTQIQAGIINLVPKGDFVMNQIPIAEGI
jgi:hypothetical protein